MWLRRSGGRWWLVAETYTCERYGIIRTWKPNRNGHWIRLCADCKWVLTEEEREMWAA